MSKLDDLINKFCPDGVEYKRLGDFASVIRGGNFQKKDFVENGKPCIHYGQMYTHFKNTTNKTLTFVSDSVFEKSKQAQPNDIVMAVTSENVEDVCSCVAWLGKENIAVSGHTAIIHHNQNPSYLSYYFHSELFFKQKVKLAHGTKVIEVTPDKLLGIEIPVPPLEVQNEIVRILDKFTSLEAELEAELEARRKQYEYYRDSLLTFGDDVEWKTIGEITDVFSAKRVYREQWQKEGVPFWRSSDLISFFNGVENSRGKAYISQELYESLSAISGKIQKDDILITGGGTIGIPYIVPTNDPLYVKDGDLLCIQHNETIDCKYLYHYFLSSQFRKYLSEITHDATIAHYTIIQIRNTPVPIPPMDKQKKIATVLDRFESLCNDITSGLPAEIEARHKQYEYYRDKLLTFNRKEG